MKKLIFLLSLIFSVGSIAQGQVSTSIPTTPKPIDFKQGDEDPKSVSAAASGAVQMENDGLRKFGTDPLRLFHGTSTIPLFRFFSNGVFELRNQTNNQLFDIGVNDAGQIEFISNGDNIFGTTSTAMTIDDDGGKFIGMGTLAPLSKLDVSGDISLSSPGLGFISKKLQFYSDQGTANQWRPGYVASGDNGSFTGRLDFFTNGTGAGNKLGSVLGMSLVNGRVGVGSSAADSPDFPLHVTSTASMINSTTGSFAIGATTGTHLNFDNNEINAWSGTTGSTLYLNFWSNAKVQIGNGSNGNLDVNGFSNLGDGAPAIKMKKFSGTIPLLATTHSIAHGLTKTKILGLQIFVESSATGNRYLPNDGAVGSTVHYEIQLDNTNIVFQNIGTNLDGEPYIIVVTYEQ